MPAKKALFSWLPRPETGLQADPILQAMRKYGLEVGGDRWVDDLNNAAWQAFADELRESRKADLWVVIGTQKDFDDPSKRFGLSMVALSLGQSENPGLPIVCLGLGFSPAGEALPTLLAGSLCLSTDQPDWPAKIVAKAFAPVQKPNEPYRLSVHVGPGMWQWYEAGPSEGEWAGVMLGVSREGKITHHGVGEAGQVPERATVEFPVKGIRATVKDTEFTAWSVQNRLDPGTSYFAKVDGFPHRIILGGHPGEDQAEVYMIELA